MHLAVMQGNPEVVELLLRQDLSGIDAMNDKHETPLHICIQLLSNQQTPIAGVLGSAQSFATLKSPVGKQNWHLKANK